MTDSETPNEAEAIDAGQDSPATEPPEAAPPQAAEPSDSTSAENPDADADASAASPSEDSVAGPDAETSTAASGAGTPDAGTPVTFEKLDGVAASAGGSATLELLYDLSLPLTVELGRAALTVQDILALGQGSVIQLDRVAGAPVDVYVGAKKLAQAEVVVLEDQFGIRITHIYADAGVSSD